MSDTHPAAGADERPHAEEFDALERDLQEAEAQQKAKHPEHEHWSPLVGQDVDGDDRAKD